MSENDRPSAFDLYKIALQTRNFEIELFWKRSNYFLVLNTAIAVGFFSGNLAPYQQFFLCLSGLLVSILWFWINLGGKYWQSKWEEELKRIEKSIKSDHWPNIGLDMFDNDRIENNDKVSANLSRSILNSLILKKPSVSRTMTYLSLLFILGWGALLLYSTFLILLGWFLILILLLFTFVSIFPSFAHIFFSEK